MKYEEILDLHNKGVKEITFTREVFNSLVTFAGAVTSGIEYEELTRDLMLKGIKLKCEPIKG